MFRSGTTFNVPCTVLTIYHQISWFLWRRCQIHLAWPVPATSSRIQNTWRSTERTVSAASIYALWIKSHLMDNKGRKRTFLQKGCEQLAHCEFLKYGFLSIVHLDTCLPSVKCMWQRTIWCQAFSSPQCWCFSPRSLSPFQMSICKGCTGRSTTLSPWFARASFTTLNPFNTTIQSWPIRKLNTFPCFSASWK